MPLVLQEKLEQHDQHELVPPCSIVMHSYGLAGVPAIRMLFDTLHVQLAWALRMTW
jgi:hypothetical protein